MSSRILLIALFSVGLSALAQLALKIGSTSALAVPATANGASTLAALFKAVVANPYIILGFVLYGAGAVTWLLVLSRVELSVAYPFVSVGLVFTLALGALVLNEPMNMTRLAGAGCIIVGVCLVARS